MATEDTHPLAQAVLEQIGAEMGARGLSVAGLARAMDQDRNTLRRYIKGEREMPLPVLTAVLEQLGLDPSVFMARARDRMSKADQAATPPVDD